MDSTTTFLLLLLATLFLAALTHQLLTPKRPAILPSPLQTLPASTLTTLAYPPTFYPGARDIASPYGSIRAYEFGPATGRKVLLVHGISTPCMTLTHIAHGLADQRGCRVLLFDLFGRGYSDGVGDVPHDKRLFIAQILCVLAASSAGWMGGGREEGGGGGGIDVVGYSLGGGIAVAFAAAFPDMVRSVVLLAPAGMIRAENFGTAARVVFRSGWVPEGVLEVLARWRLKRPIAEAAKRKKKKKAPTTVVPGVEEAVTSEIVDEKEEEEVKPNALQKSVLAFVHWQVENHAGFVTAFMSTLRFGPMFHQDEDWAKLALRKPRTVCLIFGQGDEIVNEEDYREDVLQLIGGEEHVVWAKAVKGKHDFPMVHPEETLKRIFEFWG